MILFYFLVAAPLSLFIYMYIEAHRNRVIFDTVKLDRLPSAFENFRIFFISDVHKRRISEEIVNKAEKADLVIIGGDLVEKGVPMKRVEDNIKLLSTLGPVVFVWGNNDYDVDPSVLARTLLEQGVQILDNTSYCMKRNNDQIDIVGVNDTSLRYDSLKDAIRPCSSSCRILISHNPDISKKVKNEDEICLILSGHTHGGQIRLGPLGIAKRGGWYEIGKHKLLVSNGYGATHLPLRLGAPSESHILLLNR
ncbi:metallophosphoesterase [Fictibacillus barbaricus]|uniref:Metallophosphoesterase family protein n=1 Tax=Fictibacillus barbaricus TaxID=182136 RepID=A0ABS2ZI21_9BACL|nr:metallophosphoesterase [Fictibacillus barbaricus]MBN3547814.1 metallophosphoesterase family protein [Fictibacillus barbaricus]GGB51769.1 metallophosphoesterase [Fictibacillus barbaricus]